MQQIPLTPEKRLLPHTSSNYICRHIHTNQLISSPVPTGAADRGNGIDASSVVEAGSHLHSARLLHHSQSPCLSPMAGQPPRVPRRRRATIPIRSYTMVQTVIQRSLRRTAYPLWQQRERQIRGQDKTIMAPECQDQAPLFQGAQQACAGQGYDKGTSDYRQAGRFG